MHWHVTAADARSGEERSFLVHAVTAEEAEAKVRGAGYLVSTVSQADPAAPAPHAAGEPADPLAQLAAASVATKTGPLPYRSPSNAAPNDPSPPDYWGLRFGALALFVFACLSYVTGALFVLGGLFTLVMSPGGGGPASGVVAAGLQFLLALSPLAAGVILHAASAACLALRDIARNSFADR